MEFFEAVKSRRSIRKYTSKVVPVEVIEKALDAALLAPNSSNLQTWQFYWVKSAEKKQKLVEYCLNQSAARTAQELIVVVANPTLWRKTNPEMIQFIEKVNAPKLVHSYYKKLVPMTYGYQFLFPLKLLINALVGLFKPTMRRHSTPWDIREIGIKSAALAAENLMLAITAQGYATCPMEGIDENRIKKLLGLPVFARTVMVISVGEADPTRGTWGPQVRFQRDWFVKKV